MNTKLFFKRIIRVKYRLVMCINGQCYNMYSSDGKRLAMIGNDSLQFNARSNNDYWALYKTGPLNIPERLVASGKPQIPNENE